MAQVNYAVINVYNPSQAGNQVTVQCDAQSDIGDWLQGINASWTVGSTLATKKAAVGAVLRTAFAAKYPADTVSAGVVTEIFGLSQ